MPVLCVCVAVYFSVISGFINRLTSLDTRKWVRHAINTGLLLVFVLGVFIANWQAAEHIKTAFVCKGQVS